jgi:UDP-N-acetylmuramoyl-tripeptide--D-alanyl-D-alanine ligase
VSELRLDLGWVSGATGGQLVRGDAGRTIGAIVTDSRVAQAGDLFVALQGPRFDAHEFAAELLRRDVAGVVIDVEHAGAVEADVPESHPASGGIVVVADTVRALQDIAHGIRRQSGTRVVAITGSAGKTTTKEAIAECLSSRFRVVRNKGNLNNHIGLPLSLMELRSRPDVAVMELGMNHAGEISRLVEVSEPDIRVWTNVGDAHVGFFDSVDAIADAKAEILERADAGTVLVCNADDGRVMARAARFVGRTVTFGTAPGASVRATQIEDLGLDGMTAVIATAGRDRVLTTPLLGRGNLMNVLAAVAVGLEFDVPLDDLIATVAGLTPAPRRGAVHRLRDGIRLVDDSYNSSPAALKRALEMLGHARVPGRKVAVLGEMLELGDRAVALHRECGAAVAAAGVAHLIAIGGDAVRALADGAVAAGLPAAAVTVFSRSDDAAATAVATVAPGDAVLVKGSRGIRTDVIADRLALELA